MLLVLHQQMGFESSSNGGAGLVEVYYNCFFHSCGVQLTIEQTLGTGCWLLQFHEPGGMGLAVRSSTP
jgi:hypothetical protein